MRPLNRSDKVWEHEIFTPQVYWRAVCRETGMHGSAGGHWKRAWVTSNALVSYPTES